MNTYIQKARYAQAKLRLKPLIDNYLPQPIRSRHKLQDRHIIHHCLDTQVERSINRSPNTTYETIFMESMPYYFLYGVPKNIYEFMPQRYNHILTDVVNKIIAKQIDFEYPILFTTPNAFGIKKCTIYGYIYLYLRYVFIEDQDWIMPILLEIYNHIPGLLSLDWVNIVGNNKTLFLYNFKNNDLSPKIYPL